MKAQQHEYLDFEMLPWSAANNDGTADDMDAIAHRLRHLGTLHKYRQQEPPSAIQVFVRGQDNRTVAIKLCKWELTVQHLMDKVAYHTGVPVTLQRLYHQGKVISAGAVNGATVIPLSQFQIENESTIHLNVPAMDDRAGVPQGDATPTEAAVNTTISQQGANE